MVHVAAVVFAFLAFVVLAAKVAFQWTGTDSTYAVMPEMKPSDRAIVNTTVNIGLPCFIILAILLCGFHV